VDQIRRLILVELPEIVQKYQVRSVIVPSLLNVFDENPSMRMKDVKKEISITEAINELSKKKDRYNLLLLLLHLCTCFDSHIIFKHIFAM
jgi:hypothetical protein